MVQGGTLSTVKNFTLPVTITQTAAEIVTQIDNISGFIQINCNIQRQLHSNLNEEDHIDVLVRRY